MRRFFLYVFWPVVAGAGWRFIPYLTAVNDLDPDAGYYYCAATPAAVFRYHGDVYQSPLIPGGEIGDTEAYYLTALRTYLEPYGGVKRLILIGGVPPEPKNYLQSNLKVKDEDVWEVRGDAVSVSVELARGWSRSDYAVLTPFRSPPSRGDRLSAANGAALAAFYNAPLLFVGDQGLSQATKDTLASLRVKRVVLVDWDGHLPPDLVDDLYSSGISVEAQLETEAETVRYINDVTGEASPAVCCFRGYDQLPAATFAAARYGGFVVEVPATVADAAAEAWRAAAALPRPRRKLTQPYPLPAAVREGEQGIADAFYEWLDSIGGSDPNALEYVLTCARVGGEEGIPYSLERAITGDPMTPGEDGAAPGRLPNAGLTNLITLNFTTAYRALVYANPRPRHMTFVGVAYMAQNALTCPYDFEDNYGRRHKVNEVYGCREGGYDDPGVFQDFKDFGYEPAVHDGRHEGEGTHPLVPHEALKGFQDDVRRGTGLFYSSSHGTAGGFYPFDVDDGIAANVEWGQPDWPGGPSGLVNNDGNLFSYNRWNEMTGSNAGLVACFNACDVASGVMNEVVLRHLAAAAVSSYTSVTFQGSGWFWCSFVNRLIEHRFTLGEAIAFATAQVSEIFPSRRPGVDPTIRYVLAGDPFMEYYDPGWAPPVPSDPDGDYGGHNPGGAGPLAAAVAVSSSEGKVTVRWRSRSGRRLAGWNLYRAAGKETAAYPGGGAAPCPARVNGSLIRGRTPWEYVDGDVVNGEQYYYWLEAAEENGRRVMQGPYPALPRADYGTPAFYLSQNYPNPCRGVTTIVFVVPGRLEAGLEVFDLAGRRVRRLYDGPVEEGGYKVVWDLRDGAGDVLPPGVYFYTLKAGSDWAVRRLVIAR